MTKEQARDLELSRDQLAGTWMKRYDPQLLNMAVEVHPAPGKLKPADSQETVRPGQESSFILVSISYAFPWSLLMASQTRETNS